jgi:hypothetical protein
LPTFQADNTIAKRSKVAAVWNESNIDALIALVRDLTPAVHLLFTAFTACVTFSSSGDLKRANELHSKTTFESHRILTSKDAARLFQSVDSDTQSLCTTHREQSITQLSALDGEESILGDEDFPVLDDFLVNSRVYRRVLEANLRRTVDRNPEDASNQSTEDQSPPGNTAYPDSLEGATAQADSSRSASQHVLGPQHPERTVRKGRGSFLNTMFRSRQPQRRPYTTHIDPVQGAPTGSSSSEENRTSVSSTPSTRESTLVQPPPATDSWDEVRELVLGSQSSPPISEPSADDIEKGTYRWKTGQLSCTNHYLSARCSS